MEVRRQATVPQRDQSTQRRPESASGLFRQYRLGLEQSAPRMILNSSASRTYPRLHQFDDARNGGFGFISLSVPGDLRSGIMP